MLINIINQCDQLKAIDYFCPIHFFFFFLFHQVQVCALLYQSQNKVMNAKFSVSVLKTITHLRTLTSFKL